MQAKPAPRIKVCGVTLTDDLNFLAAAGVDTIGLNFVPSSPRCISPTQGQQLSSRAAELGLLRVAVVMNMPPTSLVDLLKQVEVDFVQLHGSELPDMAAACLGLPIIKATSWTGRTEEAQLIQAWRPLAKSGTLIAIIVDAYAPASGGGTGRTACWDLLQPRPADLADIPLILAGGLNPDNVATAVSATTPHGVDTASGVELRPGVKSEELVQKFVKNLAGQWKVLQTEN